MSSRLLEQAARRFADAQTDRLAELPGARQLIATVTDVIAAGAADGNALVSVTWRGSTLVAAGYPDTYTPATGDRVKCSLVADQLLIDFRIIGHP